MKSRGLILFSILAGMLAILLYASFQEKPQEAAARQHLNNLLGQASANEMLPEPQESLKLPGVDQSFFGFPMPTTDITVEETSSKYVLRIPLAAAEDSSSVKLNVTPHRIEVSGQTGTKTDGQSFSSSFMQAFSTHQEVLPDQVHRMTEQNGDQTELVITIPKKGGSKTSAESGDGGFDHFDHQDEADERLIQPNDSPAIEPPPVHDGNPLDTYSNRFI
ncbi:hypothetical protein [Vampirovibrio sp.]|uniref:hypothetical protein n=1 Tax=Vampirovibrio sp. TaxID=2717857 RepID=UPI003593861C